jgi:hypothetical protein
MRVTREAYRSPLTPGVILEYGPSSTGRLELEGV